MNKLLWKLVRLQISPWQLAGFALANGLGLVVVLFGIQFYEDCAPIFTANDSFMKEQYVVVTKEVGLNGLTGKSTPTFSEQEIADIASQPFVDELSPFTAANFSVVASISSTTTGVGFQTEMFLEALPDKYLDINLNTWHWDKNQEQVPIVIPRNYLNLYNFGFAAGRGLPALSEQVISMIPIRLFLSGENGAIIKEGRVAGFSNRLNTILVPLPFLKIANDSLAKHTQTATTRLCINVNNPTDARLATYLSDHGYRTEGTSGDTSKIAFFLRIIAFIVVAIGLAICALAFFVMLLSVFLLLHKNMEKARTLRLIGYKVYYICLPYYALIIAIYTISLPLSLFVIKSVREYYLAYISSMSEHISIEMANTTIVIAFLLSISICSLAALIVWNKVRNNT